MFDAQQQLALVAELREVRRQRDAAKRAQAIAKQEYEAHRAAYRNVVERYRVACKRFEAIEEELLDGESAYPLLEGTSNGPPPAEPAERMEALFREPADPPKKRGRPKRERPDAKVAEPDPENINVASQVEQPTSGPNSLPEALRFAMQLPEVWPHLCSARMTGATDGEIRAVLGRWPTHCWRPWGQGPGIAWAVNGGDEPRFYLGADVSRYPEGGAATLSGRDLVKAVREACAIQKTKQAADPGRQAFIEQLHVWDEDTLCVAAAALESAVAEVVICNRCHAARRRTMHPCPSCRNPEYRLATNELAEIARGTEAARG